MRLQRDKPNFARTDLNKKKFKSKWRKPRGLHNKIRLKKAGHGKKPRVGYGSNKKYFGLVNGLRPNLITNMKELDSLSGGEGVIVSSNLGLKKKMKILEMCQDKKIKVINIRDTSKFLEKAKKEIEERRKKKKEFAVKKKAKEEKAKEMKKEEKKGKSQDEIKKEVLTADKKQVSRQVEQRQKAVLTSKTDTVRKRIIPGSRP